MESLGINTNINFFKVAQGESLMLFENEVHGVRALNFVSQNCIM